MSLLAENEVYVRPDIDVPKVRAFLESKHRNAPNTASAYGQALSRFKWFLQYYTADKGRTYPYAAYDLESIIDATLKKEVDVYKTLDDFIKFLGSIRAYVPEEILKTLRVNSIATSVVRQFTEGARAYLIYHDVDIIPQKFRNKVTVPKDRQEEDPPIEREDAIPILLAMSDQRLKAFCFGEACSGFRPIEGCAIRFKDLSITLDVPLEEVLKNRSQKYRILDLTKVYLQAKYSKNKLPREIYFTIEATEELIHWLKIKYKDRLPKPEEHVFAVMEDVKPKSIYANLAQNFLDELKLRGLTDKQEGKFRHTITLYSFRRLAETVIEDNTSENFADYILGHKKSTYYRHKEAERRRLYREKCSEKLTFLTFQKAEEKLQKEDELTTLRNDVESLREMVRELKKELSCKPPAGGILQTT
jgi:hypothetical protein